MLIQVLGIGCPKCKKMVEITEITARNMNVDFELEKVTDVAKILELGVMTTPALLVDGKLRYSGRVPSMEEVEKILKGCANG